MKNFTLLLAILLLSLSVFSKQTVISSGQVLSASTLYTNDHESMTAAQTVVNVGLCNDGSSYTVPSLHASTTIDGYGYTFNSTSTSTSNLSTSFSVSSSTYGLNPRYFRWWVHNPPCTPKMTAEATAIRPT